MTQTGLLRTTVICAAVAAWVVTVPARPSAQQAAPTPAERVAALRQSLQDGLKKIRQYEWVETTALSLKGEEKSRSQKRCYYGADGVLQKLAVGDAAPAPPAADSGGRGGRLKAKVVENKKDEMKDYMDKAAGLIQKYVPPAPEDIQRAKDRVKVEPTAAGKVRLTFADYLLPGDQLVVDVDGAANKMLGLSVASYLDKKEDTVTLTVKIGTLPDGAVYTAETVLDVKAKNIRVVTQNTGYRPIMK